MADPRLDRLQHLAATLRDTALARLRAARMAEARLARALAEVQPQPADLPDWQGDLRAAQAYNRWSDGRRWALNAELARARAQSAALVADATRAVGRQAALERLAQKQAARDCAKRDRWSCPPE